MSQDNQNTLTPKSTQNTQSIQNTPSTLNSQSAQNNQSPQTSPVTFLPKHGHYRNLRVYQVTVMVYDITYYFTQHYLCRTQRQTEYCGGQPSRCYIKRDGNQTDQCGQSQFGRTA